MRTCLSARGVSVLSLIVASVSAFACAESPTQPGPISDSMSDSPVVSTSRPFDAPPSLTGPADPIDEQPADTEYLEEELTEVSELTDVEEIDDASDLDFNDLEAGGLDANSLTIKPATAAASKTVVLSGVIRDKKRQTLKIAGVTVKAAGIQATSNASGRFTLRVRPGNLTITFKKTGYKTASLKKRVTRATSISVSLTAAKVTGPPPPAPPPPPPPTPTPTPTSVVARFTYAPSPCEIVAHPSTPATPLKATCTFDASDSTAPAGSTYEWSFPGGETFATKTLSDATLACGLPNGLLFQRTVSLTVKSPGNNTDTKSMAVNFKKSKLC